MVITTKYYVGYTFWVPRCRIVYETETKIIDGTEWKRDIAYHKAYAKQKKIKKVVASVSEKGTYIQYYIVDANDPDTFAQVYEEVDINNYDEQEALTIAMQYQNKKEEYFGT